MWRANGKFDRFFGYQNANIIRLVGIDVVNVITLLSLPLLCSASRNVSEIDLVRCIRRTPNYRSAYFSIQFIDTFLILRRRNRMVDLATHGKIEKLVKRRKINAAYIVDCNSIKYGVNGKLNDNMSRVFHTRPFKRKKKKGTSRSLAFAASKIDV